MVPEVCHLMLQVTEQAAASEEDEVAVGEHGERAEEGGEECPGGWRTAAFERRGEEPGVVGEVE